MPSYCKDEHCLRQLGTVDRAAGAIICSVPHASQRRAATCMSIAGWRPVPSWIFKTQTLSPRHLHPASVISSLFDGGYLADTLLH